MTAASLQVRICALVASALSVALASSDAGGERGGPSGFGDIRVLGLTLGAAVLLVLVVLGVSGVVLGVWALLGTARRARPDHTGQ